MGKQKNDEPFKVDRHIRSVVLEDWDAFIAVKDQYRLTWQEIFHRFRMYENGIRYIFEAPGEWTKGLTLDVNTCMGLIQLWVGNMRENFMAIQKGQDVTALLKGNPYRGKPGLVIGAGPSLHEHKHLETLAREGFDGPIYCCAHALKDCLEAGVVPTYTGIVDADEKMRAFIDHDIIDEYSSEINMVFIASAHPSCVERWSGPDSKRFWFLSGVPQNLIPNVDTLIADFFPGITHLDTGGNSGSAGWIFLAYANCTPIGMIGLDFAYPEGFPYDQTQYHAAWQQSIGKEGGYVDEADLIEKCYPHFTHPYFKNHFYRDFVYGVFNDAFINFSKTYKKQFGTDTVNCTQGGGIYAKHIRYMKFTSFLEKYGGGKPK